MRNRALFPGACLHGLTTDELTFSSLAKPSSSLLAILCFSLPPSATFAAFVGKFDSPAGPHTTAIRFHAP